ncbi:MAG: T9SS type A sorting domain-containing protein, partial [Bacteroidia bacterium]
MIMAEAITPVDISVDGVAQAQVVLGQNYPNPAKGKTVILVEFTSSEAVLSIYNVLGKLVEHRLISADQKRITLDVSDYKEGIYLYSIEADGQKVTKRMTVSK